MSPPGGGSGGVRLSKVREQEVRVSWPENFTANAELSNAQEGMDLDEYR